MSSILKVSSIKGAEFTGMNLKDVGVKITCGEFIFNETAPDTLNYANALYHKNGDPIKNDEIENNENEIGIISCMIESEITDEDIVINTGLEEGLVLHQITIKNKDAKKYSKSADLCELICRSIYLLCGYTNKGMPLKQVSANEFVFVNNKTNT